MKALFDKVSHACSKYTTEVYSTSFSLGILLLSKRLRAPIYGIYGFVRLADEIVDSFHGYDKYRLIEKLKDDTAEAISDKISLNPILNSFQEVVHEYSIEQQHIDAFFHSMEMDLQQISYDNSLYNEYIYGSAEVVGLMCLHVFVEGRLDQYEILKPYARRLGAAFQKINFLRDVKADYDKLGRSYFPDVDLKNFSDSDKRLIEKDIKNDFDEALKGIRKLPLSSRGGVYLAYLYYLALFQKIKQTNHSQIMQKRIRVSNFKKTILIFESAIRLRLNIL